MSRIVIIGGDGKVALHLARVRNDRGDEVTSVFRNPEHADDVSATAARPVVATSRTWTPTGWPICSSATTRWCSPRAPVAATRLVVAAALREPSTVHRTIDFNSGDLPIAEALTTGGDRKRGEAGRGGSPPTVG